MKKHVFVLMVFLALTAVVSQVWVVAQTCERQTAQVTGYTGGDDSTLAVLEGITTTPRSCF